MKLDIEYSLAGQNTSIHTDVNNDDLSFKLEEKDLRKVVTIKAKKDIRLVKCTLNDVHEFNQDDIFALNGYQSWTDTKETSLKEKFVEKDVYKIPGLVRNMFAFDRYGDALFYKYNKNILHGYNIFYVKGKKELFSYNHNYKNAYLIYQVDKAKHNLSIISDVDGVLLKKGEEFVAVDLYYNSNYKEGLEAFHKEFVSESEKVFGYTSWYNYYQNINESIILRDLESLDNRFNLFQIDDGYETFIGDWLEVDKTKFPNGLKPIVDKIHEKGLKAGIWLAPFVAETKSKLFNEHQDWFKKDPDGKLSKCGSNWSGFYALDLSRQDVKDYIRKCLEYYMEIGFDFFKLDFLYSSMIAPTEGMTRAMMSNRSYQFLRDVLKDKLILGCGANCFSSYQKFNYLRIGPDVSLKFDDVWFMKYMHRERISTKITLQNTIYRSIFNHHLFLNDPDVFLLRDTNIDLSKEQKRALVTINALFGSVLMTSDNIATYTEESKKLLEASLDLFKNAKDKEFKKIGENIQITYTLHDEQKELVYNTKKGILL